MISWIQHLLQTKGRFLFIILLGVVIVSFVFVIGETPGCVTPQAGTVERKYYGYNLDSQASTREMIEEVIISSIINRGQQPRDSQMMEQEFLSRAALLSLADELNIPAPSQRAFQRYLAGIPMFQDEQGRLDPSRITNFLDMAQLSQQFTEATINRTLTNDYRLRQVVDIIAAPGFALAYDVESQARRNESVYSLSVAFLDKSAFEPDLEITESGLETFYRQRAESYRVPETRILELVLFSPESYLDSIEEPGSEVLQTYFDNNILRYMDEESQEMPSLENVRIEVWKDWKAEQADHKARVMAEEFVYEIFDREMTIGDPEYLALLEAYKVEPKELSPMIGGTPPETHLLKPDQFIIARRLDSIRFYSDPIETNEGLAVLLLKEILPPRIPELNEIREVVKKDYKTTMRRRAFVEYGQNVRSAIEEAISGGQTFAEAAEARGLQVEEHQNVSWTNQPERLPRGSMQEIENLPDLEVSSMEVTENQGVFLFVHNRKAPLVPENTMEFATMRNILTSDHAQRYVASFLDEMIQIGLVQAERNSRR